MLIILGCPLPDMAGARPGQLCGMMAKRLDGVMDEGRQKHVLRFVPPLARAGRLLSALMLLEAIPKATIANDALGRPFLPGLKAAVSFSYTRAAVFCGLAHGDDKPTFFGLDAECREDWPKGTHGPCGLRQMKDWTRREASGKALGIGLAAPDTARLDARLHYCYLAAPEHIICVASGRPRKPYFRWLHYSELLK